MAVVYFNVPGSWNGGGPSVFIAKTAQAFIKLGHKVIYDNPAKADVCIAIIETGKIFRQIDRKKTRVILQSTYLKLGNKTQTIITGINGEPATLKLYPNPSPGVSYLSSSAANGGTWQLIDQRGVIVLRGELRKGSERNPSEINVSGISNGLYIMKVVQDGGQVAYEKLIVNNQN